MFLCINSTFRNAFLIVLMTSRNTEILRDGLNEKKNCWVIPGKVVFFLTTFSQHRSAALWLLQQQKSSSLRPELQLAPAFARGRSQHTLLGHLQTFRMHRWDGSGCKVMARWPPLTDTCSVQPLSVIAASRARQDSVGFTWSRLWCGGSDAEDVKISCVIRPDMCRPADSGCSPQWLEYIFVD